MILIIFLIWDVRTYTHIRTKKKKRNEVKKKRKPFAVIILKMDAKDIEKPKNSNVSYNIKTLH